MSDAAVVALHGDFARGWVLRRDMGDPDWCDFWPDWKRINFWMFRDSLAQLERLILIGYSKGGSEIATLSHYLDNLVGAVLYESPMLKVREPAGSFPIMWIENDRSWYRNTREMADTRVQWRKGRARTTAKGSGYHVKRWPPGHGWDKTLNDSIAEWIGRVNGA